MSIVECLDDNYVAQLNYNIDGESLADAATRCFPIGSTWCSLSVLKDGLHKFSSIWGFHTVRQAMKLCCSRYGCTNSLKAKKGYQVPIDKQRVRGSVLKAGCTFCIKFRYSQMNEVVVIYGACYQHLESSGCVPSPLNLIFVRKAGGHYAKLQIEAMKKLLIFYEKDNVSPKVLRKLLKDFLPSNVPIDAQFMVNMRLKAKMLLPKWKANGMVIPQDLNSKLDYIGLDDMEELYHDQASVEARNLLHKVLQEDGESISIERYLKELKQVHDSSFDYRVAKDDDGVLLGVIWQTAAMRGMFEDYGDVLFTDVMKREMNNIRWPYISLTVLDSMCSIHVAVEGLICGEYLDAYSWVIKSAFDMTPRKSLDSVKVIYADQFLNESALIKAGFISPPLLAFDYWHLIDSALPKKFGRHLFLQIKEQLCRMINANNINEFEQALSDATVVLCNDPEKMTKLREFATLRRKYAKFELWNCSGSLQRRGSVVAEQNHSSYVARIGPLLTVNPSVTICEMIERQKDVVKEKNYRLTKYKFKVNNISMKRKIGEVAWTLQDRDVILYDGYSYLSEWGFQIFSKEVQQFNEYICCEDVNHPCEYLIYRTNQSLDKARRLTKNTRCDCDTRVSFGIMCRHELVLHKCFVPELFQSRWQLVDQVRLSSSVIQYDKDNNEESVSTVPEMNGTITELSNSLQTVDTATLSSNIGTPVTSNVGASPTDSLSPDDIFVFPKGLSRGSVDSVSSLNLFNGNEHLQGTPTYNDFIELAGNVYSQCQHNDSVCKLAFGALVEIQKCLMSGSVVRQQNSLQQYLANTSEFFNRFTTSNSSDTKEMAVSQPAAIPNTHRPSWSRILSPGEASHRSSKTAAKRKLSFFSSMVEDAEVACVVKRKACCSFCHKPGHVNSKSSPCDMLLSWGTAMGKDVNNIHNLGADTAYYMSYEEFTGDILESLCSVTMKHMVIHKFVVNALANAATRAVIHSTEVFACVTCLNDVPEEVNEFRNRLVTLPTLCSWITRSSKTCTVIDGRSKVNTNVLLKWRRQSIAATFTRISVDDVSVCSDINESSCFTGANVEETTKISEGVTFEDDDRNKKLSAANAADDDDQSKKLSAAATIVGEDQSKKSSPKISAAPTFEDNYQNNKLSAADTTDDDDESKKLSAVATTVGDDQSKKSLPKISAAPTTDDDDQKEKVLALGSYDLPKVQFRVGDTVRYSYTRTYYHEYTLRQGVVKEIKTFEEIIEDEDVMMVLTNGHVLGFYDPVCKVSDDTDVEGATSNRWVQLMDYDDDRKNFDLLPGKLVGSEYSGGYGSVLSSFNNFVVNEWEKF